MNPIAFACLAVSLAAAGASGWLVWRAFTMRRMRLEREVQLRTRQLQHLNDVLQATANIGHLIHSEKDPQTLLQKACEVLVHSRGYVTVWMGRPEPDSKLVTLVAHAGAGAGFQAHAPITWDDTPQGRGPTGTAIRERRPVVVEDTHTDPSLEPWREAVLSASAASLAAVPVMHGDRLFGSLTVKADQVGAFDAAEMKLLTALAADLALALTSLEEEQHRKRAEMELRLLTRLYALLSRVNESVTRSRSDRELFQKTCDAAVAQGGFKLAWVGLVNATTQEVMRVAAAGQAIGYLEGIQIYADERPEGRGPTGTCIRTGQPYICNDFANDARMDPWQDRGRKHGLKAAATLPIYAEGKVIGALVIYNDEVDCFRREEVALLLEISNSLSFALDNLATRQKASQLSRAVEQSPVSIVITDLKGSIEYVNPKFAQVTGYSPAEVLGKNPRILKSGETTAEQARQYKELWATILSGKEWRGEFHNQKKNGELFWESASVSPITDAGGHITHFLAVKEDITKQKLLEDELRHAQKMEAFGRLSAGVAHDFNNLLTAIMGNLELLKLEGPLPPASGEALGEIAKAAERAANLTRQLLLFSRRKPMQAQALDLKEVVASVSKMLRRLIGENIELQERHHFGDTRVLADAGMLEQLLMNLSVNARDAMPKGGQLTIATSAVTIDQATARRRPGPFIRLSVSDTGCGISPEVREHIFEPFFTTKEVGKGTGLGLATVFGIVEQHKGWIEVETEMGRGTAFHIYLPHHQASPETKSVPPSKTRELGGTETILLVEDEPAVRGLARTLLTRRGYRIYEAESPERALEIWRQHQPEIALLFTDMIMPGRMNGLDLSQRLRLDKPGLKVVYTSGYNDEILRENSALRHAANFLQKPYSAEVLLKAIRAELDKS